MIYVLCEDSTSGYDFVKTIIERVIKPKVGYEVLTLGGCRNVNNLLASWSNCNLDINYSINGKIVFRQLNRGDKVILYADRGTLSTGFLSSVACVFAEFGLELYLQPYYCFEAVLFSYKKFGTVYKGNTKLHNAFMEVRTMFNDGRFDLIKLSKLCNVKYRGTVEQFADLLFSTYFKTLSCCCVSKKGYVPLDVACKQGSFAKGFYNNLCKNVTEMPKGTQNTFDDKCYTMSKRLNLCKGYRRTTGNTANLRDFYNNTYLSDNLYKLDYVCDTQQYYLVESDRLDVILR